MPSTKLVGASLDDRITSIALGQENRIYMLGSVSRQSWHSTRLFCYSSDGEPIWQRDVDALFYDYALQVTGDGTIWVNTGKMIQAYKPDGSTGQAYSMPGKPDEEIGGFVVADGSIYLCSFSKGVLPDQGPCVMRCGSDGELQWATILPMTSLEYKGVVGLGEIAIPGRGIRPLKPWTPTSWQTRYVNQPILSSGDRLLVCYAENRSGIKISYALEKSGGSLVWTTPSLPITDLVALGSGRFLIGTQGYDAFDTYLYERDGAVSQHWKSNGYPVIDEIGEIRVVEMENRLPSKMHFAMYQSDGQVRKGPHLDEYYSSYPAVDAKGTTVFWRNGQLLAVSKDLDLSVLFSDKRPESYEYVSRMLLTNEGKLVFTREGELWIFDDLNLGPLANSVWPCGRGNPGGAMVVD